MTDVRGYIVSWLVQLKNSIVESKGEKAVFHTGYLVSCRYIDEIIRTMIEQQTIIEELESKIKISEDYAAAWGDFAGYTPQEMTPLEQEALKRHMQTFADEWSKRQEDEE